MSQIAVGFEAGYWQSPKTNSLQQNFGNDAQRQNPSYANNSAEVAADMWLDGAAVTPTVIATNPDEIAVTVTNLAVSSGHYTDYHYRIWIIPRVMQLSNPQLDTPIPFSIWQTFPTSQTVQSIDVDGSEVLTFALEEDDTLHDHQYLTSSLQIGDGEAAIEAIISFIFEDGEGTLTLLATVSSTFNFIYSVPVIETWEFLTDILTSYNNKEQRISLRPRPRINLDINVAPIDMAERRLIYGLLMKNMKVRALVPLYQYGVNASAVTEIGGFKLFFNPALTNVREGFYVIAVQPSTGNNFVAEIQTLEADGAVVGSASSFRIDRNWVIAPAFNCLLQDGSGFNVKSVSADVSIQAKSINEPTLARPNATETITIFDGFPVLEKQPLAGAEEKFTYHRDVIDSSTGVRDLSSGWPVSIVGGRRQFSIRRYDDPDSMDYWREFFNIVRGSHKRFLMSTWLPDLTLVGTPIQGASSFIINESDYVNVYFPFATFKHIQIETSNGALHNATVTSAITDASSVTTINFTPALPDEPYTMEVERISFLNIVRSADKIRLEHKSQRTIISFVIKQVEA